MNNYEQRIFQSQAEIFRFLFVSFFFSLDGRIILFCKINIFDYFDCFYYHCYYGP